MNMMTEIIAIEDPNSLIKTAEFLLNGGLAVFPTDTVYGIGALAFNEQAVSRISEVKGRVGEKAIPILIGEFSQLSLVATGISKECEKLAERFWPGPLTIVMPRHLSIPDAVTPLPTVGVRIPDFAATIELLKLTGPLAVSSANLAGMGSSSTARGVHAQLNGKVGLILDGGVTPGGIPSTVMEFSNGQPVVLREGPITLEQILDALH